MYIHITNGIWDTNKLPDSYKVGKTEEEFLSGAYYKMTSAQRKFMEQNFTASPLQILRMKVDVISPYIPGREELIQAEKIKINQQVEQNILSGFIWGGMPVWLSTENQMNYKAAYDLAVQLSGATLPVRFKFGTDEIPVYFSFDNMSEFTDFYTKALQHIQNCYQYGWDEKDSLNLKTDEELLALWKGEINNEEEEA